MGESTFATLSIDLKKLDKMAVGKNTLGLILFRSGFDNIILDASFEVTGIKNFSRLSGVVVPILLTVQEVRGSNPGLTTSATHFLV